MRPSVFVLPILIGLLLIIPAMPLVKATGPAEVVRVFAPTAYGGGNHGTIFGLLQAGKLDGSPEAIMDEGDWVRSNHFTNPSYVNYWTPYANRSNFPPNNATILSISMIAIVWCQIPRSFSLNLEFWNGTGYEYYYGGGWNAAWTAQLYTHNVTSDRNWTASDITDITNHTLSVSVTIGPTSTKAVYIDYVGIDYIWTNSTTSGGTGGESALNVVSIDVPGIMGIFGFVGMIAVPAASIWFYRRDGGSKVATAIIALVAFLICFGMFFGVLNG